MKFYGYPRPDGKVGIRNKILILPTVACSSETARVIAAQVPEAISIINQHGCGEVKGNLDIVQETLSGLAANPNVFGTIIVGLGCESNTPDQMYELIKTKTNKPLYKIIIQEEGGTPKTICKAVQYAKEMVQQASQVRREECDLSALMLGIECGGSDATSGLAANPVVGNASDRLIDFGGSSVLSETAEFIGAEHILARRGVNKEVKKRIIEICSRLEKYLSLVNEDLRSGQPTPGNKDGGISTIEEKSLGCIYKGGTKPVMEVLEYSQMPREKGLVIMDTPGYDIASVTGMVAGGCQLVVFTTGRGTPTGDPIAPVIKITANKTTYDNMVDNMDVDVSAVIRGEKTIEQMGEDVLLEIVRVANGKITKAEAYGFADTAICKICNYI